MTATKRTPMAAHAIAKAIDVEPLDASTTTDASSSPAVARMRAAMRSFVDPLGISYSSFTQIVQPLAASLIGTVGVTVAAMWSSAARFTSKACPLKARPNSLRVRTPRREVEIGVTLLDAGEGLCGPVRMAGRRPTEEFELPW